MPPAPRRLVVDGSKTSALKKENVTGGHGISNGEDIRADGNDNGKLDNNAGSTATILPVKPRRVIIGLLFGTRCTPMRQ